MPNFTIHKHESFALRKGWLHKGIRNIMVDARLFTRSDGEENKACDKLGIRVNMVKAMRYWMNATKVMTENAQRHQFVSPIGAIINQHDPYFEERGTNYIIHYLLASNKQEATAWWWFFNKHNGLTIDKAQFVEDFNYYLKSQGEPESKVLEGEFDVLMRTYYDKSEGSEKFDPEETRICPLTELRLVTLIDSKTKEYKKVMPDKDDIHPLIAYAVISEKQRELGATQIQISELLLGENNIGRIFNLDRSTVFYIIERLEQMGYLSIVRTAGLDVINIRQQHTLLECLTLYYQTLEEVGNA